MLCAIQDTLCNIEESLWGGFESPPDFSYIADGCPVLFSLSPENRTLRYFGRYTTVMTICWREVITCYPLPCHFFGSSILLSFDLGQWCKIDAKLYRVTLLFELCQTEKKSGIICRRHFSFYHFHLLQCAFQCVIQDGGSISIDLIGFRNHFPILNCNN